MKLSLLRKRWVGEEVRMRSDDVMERGIRYAQKINRDVNTIGYVLQYMVRGKYFKSIILTLQQMFPI